MVKEKEKIAMRTCKDCGKDISHLYYNAIRCKACSKKRKQQQDHQRHKEKRSKQVKWQFLIEDSDTKELFHRSAKGSKLRYWLDKICKELTIQELEFLRIIWNWRIKEPRLTPHQKWEYRTCAGIIRDWRDYFVVDKVFNDVSFDSETGVIFNTDGTYFTVDFDEEQETYIVRNTEGTIICNY